MAAVAVEGAEGWRKETKVAEESLGQPERWQTRRSVGSHRGWEKDDS